MPKTMWLLIFGVIVLLTLGGVFYLVLQFHRFRVLQQLSEKHKWLSWMLAVVPVLLVLSSYFIWPFAVYIILLHLMFIWMLCNLAAHLLGKCLHRAPNHDRAGIAAISLTAAVLVVAWHFAHHVYETDYCLETQKNLGGEPLRIAMIADSHLSITLDGEKFAAELNRIEAQSPDVLLICGDFVDDDTQYEDMTAACAALGNLDLKYGVYYVYGNHDLGYYSYRSFTADDLRQNLTENGIHLLADETMLIDGRFSITGRLDHSMQRKDAAALAAETDSSIYRILLDHQPNDYDAEAAAGFDLVVSGHTHGGHIFPAGQIGVLFGANDALYGLERRGSTDFIVTSGISGWAIPFKTGCLSEYCIIDVVNAGE